MSNIHASLIIDSLAKANDNLAKRRRIEQEYESVCPAEWRMPPRNAPWVYDVRPLNPKGGPLVPLAVRALNQAGIAAREGFKPCSRQEEYSKCRLVANRDGAGWTVADRAANEVLYLPIEPGEYLDKPPLKAFEIIKGVIG
jgi:dTDP-4-amino-4,6-dideoxygalactose transaminase